MHAVAQEATISYQMTKKNPQTTAPYSTYQQQSANVMSSSAEAELRELFLNDKTAVPMLNFFEELGHPQPRTTIQTDKNSRRSYK